jgi:hypothetical protein
MAAVKSPGERASEGNGSGIFIPPKPAICPEIVSQGSWTLHLGVKQGGKGRNIGAASFFNNSQFSEHDISFLASLLAEF